MEEKISYEKKIAFNQLMKILSRKIKRLILAGIIVAVIITSYKCITSGSTMAEATRITLEPREHYLGIAKIFLGNESTTVTSNAAKIYLIGNDMLQSAVDELNLDLTYLDLELMINFNSSTDNIIVINVYGPEEKIIQDVTNYLAIAGVSELKKLLSSNEIKLLESANTVYREYKSEVSETIFSTSELVKKLVKYFITGFLLGVLFTSAIYTIIYVTDDTIKDDKDVQGYLGIPIIGSISTMEGTSKQVEIGKKKRKLRLTQYSKEI